MIERRGEVCLFRLPAPELVDDGAAFAVELGQFVLGAPLAAEGLVGFEAEGGLGFEAGEGGEGLLFWWWLLFLLLVVRC